jgi:hypothetical protein
MLKRTVPIEYVSRSPYRPIAPLPSPDALAAFVTDPHYAPPVVRDAPARHGLFELLLGEATWRLLQAAGHHTIDVRVLANVDDDLAKTISGSDARSDGATPAQSAAPARPARGRDACASRLAIGAAINALIADGDMRLNAAAARFGLSATEAAHYRRVLTLPEAVLALGRGGHLSFGQLRALARIAEHEARAIQLAREIVGAARGTRYRRASSMTVRQIEQRVAQILSDLRGSAPRRDGATRISTGDTPENRIEERRLTEACGHTCTIRYDPKSTTGWISIRFCDLDDYEAVADLIAPRPHEFD